jgi:glucose/arabinose dehydrogenase
MSEDIPEDELNRVTKTGQHFGSPFCYQGNVLDAELGWGKSCADYEKPAALMGPHSAALGMRFNTSAKFPAKYKNTIFVARHGSWNRSKKVGGDIIAVNLDDKGAVKSVEPFMTGFLGADNNYVARPVDVLFLKDGSMLVSDDFNGAVYRVSYGK